MIENSPTPPQESSLSPTQIKSILEAILFVANEPISIKQFTQVFGNVSTHDIREQLMALENDYQAENRSFQLIEIANGFQVCSRPEYRDWIEKFYTRQVRVRLSPPALETLAIVAYKQPVTRTEVEEIRGVNSDSVVNSLIQKGLIRISGRKPGQGRSLLFSTTDKFLEQFGLKNLSELPSMEEIEEILHEVQNEE